MRAMRIGLVLGAAISAMSVAAADLNYLHGLLAATPQGGWVKAGSNSFGDAWPVGQDLPPPTPSGPEAVAYAWAGFAWDSNRGNLMLYGGGHANYVGNEVYLWRGSDGAWTRGTLPSRVDLTTGLVMGDGAPQSAHTYQTNSYVPVNDRFVVFGGAAWNSGSNLANAGGRTGPWWWDPSKADPNLVGGADGSGWDASRQGAAAWQARPYDPWVGLPAALGRGYAFGSTAYRTEGGKDVIYLTMDQQGSGLPALMRYELGDGSTPDTWSQVGDTWNSFLQSGAAMIDSRRGLFVRTALSGGPLYQSDLAVWNLANNNPANPYANRDTPIQLVDELGGSLDLSFASSIDYDSANDQYVIWDGRSRGKVWVTTPEYLSGGALDPVWTVHMLDSSTAAEPAGLHGDGVLGKWKYVSELEAFVAMDSYNSNTRDAAIWLYKPIVAVPEARTLNLFLAGLGAMAWLGFRRRSASGLR